MSELQVIGVPGIPEVAPGVNLGKLIAQSIGEAGLKVKDRDILVVAQKIVSKAGPRPMARTPGWLRSF